MKALIKALKHDLIDHLSTEERQQAIIELHKTMSWAEIAEKLNSNRSTVRGWADGMVSKREASKKRYELYKHTQKQAERQKEYYIARLKTLRESCNNRISNMAEKNKINLTQIIEFLRVYVPKTRIDKQKVMLISTLALDCSRRYKE